MEGALALLGAFLLSTVLTWPLLLELGDHILGLGGDSTGTIAGFRLWANETGFSILGTSHVSSVGAPFGYEQGNGVNLQSAFVFLPAYLVTELLGEVVAYNLVVLSGLAFSGAAMYWLVRWLGCSSLVAAWAGVVFVVFPWHLEKAQGHVSLAHLEGFPLLLLAVLAWYRRPDFRRALFIAGALAILWTTSGYFGFMGLVALGPLLLLAVIFFAREGGFALALRRIVAPVVVWLGVPAAVFAIASRGEAEGEIAPARSVGDLLPYGARPWEYFVPSYRNPLFGDEVGPWLVRHLHGSNFSEASLYVGWITVVFAGGWLLWALVKRSRLRPEVRFATAALAVTVFTGLVFSLPTPLPRTDIPTPVRLIWEAAPQFRVPARFIALVMAGLVPLAALGLEGVRSAIERRLRPGVLAAAAAAGVCVVAGVLSFVELSILPRARLTSLEVPPPEYAAVRKAPRGLIAEYPLAPSNQAINSDYLFWQRDHGRRIVNGAPLGTFADAVGQTLVDPTTPGTAQSLAALGASAVVVRPNTYAFIGGPTLDPTRPRSGYRVLATTPSGASVWQVVASPTQALAAFGSGFFSPESIHPGSTMRWMDSTGTVHLFSTRRGVYEATFSVISYRQPRKIRIEGLSGSRTFDVQPTAPNTVSLALLLPRGRSSLRVTANPGSEPIPDGRMVTVYMSNWTLKRDADSRGDAPLVPLSADGSR